MSRKRYQTSYGIPIGLPNPQLYTHIQRMQTLLEQYDLQNNFLNKQVIDILNKKQTLPKKYESTTLKNKKPQYKIKRFTQIDQIQFDDSSANILERIKKQRLQIQQQKKEIQRQRSIQIQRRKANSAKKFQYYDQSQDKKIVSSTAYKRNSFYNPNSRKFNYVLEQQQKNKNTKFLTKVLSPNNKYYTKSFFTSSQKTQNLNSLCNSNKISDNIKQNSSQKNVAQNKNNIVTKSISKSKQVLQKINQTQQEDKIKQTQRQKQRINLQTSNNIVHVLKRQVYFKSPDQSKVSSPEKRDESPLNKNYENVSRISIKSDQSKSKLNRSRSGISVTSKKSPQKKQAKNQPKQSPQQIQKFNIQQLTQTPIRSIHKIQKQDIKISESIIKIQHKQQHRQQDVNASASASAQQNTKQNISIQLTEKTIQPTNLNLRIPQVSNRAGKDPIMNQNPPAGFQSIRTKYLTSIGINTQPYTQPPQPIITRNKSISYHQINPSQKITINKAAIEHKQKTIQRTKSVDKKKKFINIVSSDFVSNKLWKNRQNK